MMATDRNAVQNPRFVINLIGNDEAEKNTSFARRYRFLNVQRDFPLFKPMGRL